MSVDLTTPAGLPAGFRRAVAGLAGVTVRPEVTVSDMPPPQRLAPYAVAVHAVAHSGADEVAEGRLVILHDPDGQDVWFGDTRCVAYLQASVDHEMATDPMLAGVGWSWLLECLEQAKAEYTAAGGTVTRTSSERFGALAEHPPAAEIEIRASWSPTGPLDAHLVAFSELLCIAGGLPPAVEGVVVMPVGKPRRARSAHRNRPLSL